MRESVIKDESAEVSRRVIFFCVVMGLSLLAAVFMFFSVLYLPNIMASIPENREWDTNVAIYHIFTQFEAISKMLQKYIESGMGIGEVSSLLSSAILIGCIFSFLVPLIVCAVTGIMCAVNKRFSVNRILIAVWLFSAVSFFVISNMFDHGFAGKDISEIHKSVSWGAVLNVIFALGAYCATFFNTKKFKLSSIVWAGCGALGVLTVCLLAVSIGSQDIFLSKRFVPQSIINRFMLYIKDGGKMDAVLTSLSGGMGLASTFGILIFSLAVPLIIMFLPKDKKFSAPILIVSCALVAACALFALIWLGLGSIKYNEGNFEVFKNNATVPFILILSILNTVAMAVAPILLKKIKKY